MSDYFPGKEPELPQPKKRSNSDRQRERRERKARHGIKQVNVEGTETVRSIVKEIASRSGKGEELYKILQDLTWQTVPKDKLPKRRSQTEIDRENYLKKLAYQLNSLRGWRRSFVFWIID